MDDKTGDNEGKMGGKITTLDKDCSQKGGIIINAAGELWKGCWNQKGIYHTTSQVLLYLCLRFQLSYKKKNIRSL